MTFTIHTRKTKRAFTPLTLLIATFLVAVVGLLFFSSNAYATPNNFPADYTAPGVKPAPGSNYDGTYAAADTVTSVAGSNFWLWCKDGNNVVVQTNSTPPANGCDSYNGGNGKYKSIWANRSNGDLGSDAAFEVIVPQTVLNGSLSGSDGFGKYVAVDIKDGCKSVSDNIGWEDHTDTPPANWENGGTTPIKAYVTGQLHTKGYNVCNGNQDDKDLHMRVYSTSFVPNSKYLGGINGFPVAVAEVHVVDYSGNNSEKVFGVSAPTGIYVGPADTRALQGLKAPDNESFTTGYVNLQNPQADYAYQVPGPCGAGALSENCNPYGSLDESRNNYGYSANAPDDFNFHFSPDCAYGSGDSTTLYWRDGQGNSTTQPDNGSPSSGGEYWTLTDNGRQVASASYGELGAGVNSKFVGHLNPGDDYVWTWHNVDRAHGVSVQLPFTEYTSAIQLQCPSPVGKIQYIDLRCINITLYGFDQTQQQPGVQFQIYNQTRDGSHLNPDYFGTYKENTAGNPATFDVTAGMNLSDVNLSYKNSQTGYSSYLKYLFSSRADNKVTFYQRILDPVDNNWYWVWVDNSGTAHSELSTDTTNLPSQDPGHTFKRECNGGGSSVAPQGSLDNTSCLFGANGWAVDPDYATNPIQVRAFVMVSKDGRFDDWQVLPYFYKSVDVSKFNGVGTGVYNADGPSANPFQNGHRFSIPVDPNRSDPRDPWLLDGYRYKFLIYPIGVDQDGDPDGIDTGAGANNAGFNGFPGNTEMLSCANFQTQSNTRATLNSNHIDNPTSYTTTSSASVSYPGLSSYNSAAGGYSYTTSWTASKSTEDASFTNQVNPFFNPPVNVPGQNPCVVNTYFTRGGVTSTINSTGCVGIKLTTANQVISIPDPTGATVQPPQVGDQYCASLTLQYANGLIQEQNGTGNNVLVPGGGYTDNQQCDHVVNTPYTHFFGNDVSAGGGFGAGCTATAGGISTFTYGGGSPPPQGSGVQIGALSIGPIYGFNSALIRGSPPSGPEGLSFSNTKNGTGGAEDSPPLGGNFNDLSHCVPDYHALKPANAAPLGTASGNLSSGAYTAPNGTVLGNLNVPAKTNAVIFVDGDITLTGNITYGSDAGCASSGVDDPCWSSIDDIPSLYIIDYGGNIKIAPNVSQLDGLYVSQPNGSTGGNIYTCTTTDIGSVYGSCNSQLVVNGAFVAQHLYLLRSFGTLRNSYPGEHLQTKAQGCDGGGTNYGDCAAEVFNYSPEIYLSQPSLTPSSGPTTGKYDYVTSLSPVL